MKENIDKLIKDHCRKLRKVDTNVSVAKIIRNIDKLTQQAQNEIYKLRDGEIENKPEKKRVKVGHCC
jgi:hypothetical protein